MYCFTPNPIEKAVFDGATVDTQLYAAGTHIALIIDGIGFGGQDVTILTADGQRAAAEVAGNLAVIRHRTVLPRRQQRRQDVVLLHAVADLHHFHGDAGVCQHAGVDIPQFLDDITHEAVKIGGSSLAVGLDRAELHHGAADGDSRSGPVGQPSRT